MDARVSVLCGHGFDEESFAALSQSGVGHCPVCGIALSTADVHHVRSSACDSLPVHVRESPPGGVPILARGPRPRVEPANVEPSSYAYSTALPMAFDVEEVGSDAKRARLSASYMDRAPLASAPAPANAATLHLLEMGFDRDDIARALSRANNSLEDAVAFLTTDTLASSSPPPRALRSNAAGNPRSRHARDLGPLMRRHTAPSDDEVDLYDPDGEDDDDDEVDAGEGPFGLRACFMDWRNMKSAAKSSKNLLQGVLFILEEEEEQLEEYLEHVDDMYATVGAAGDICSYMIAEDESQHFLTLWETGNFNGRVNHYMEQIAAIVWRDQKRNFNHPWLQVLQRMAAIAAENSPNRCVSETLRLVGTLIDRRTKQRAALTNLRKDHSELEDSCSTAVPIVQQLCDFIAKRSPEVAREWCELMGKRNMDDFFSDWSAPFCSDDEDEESGGGGGGGGAARKEPARIQPLPQSPEPRVVVHAQPTPAPSPAPPPPQRARPAAHKSTPTQSAVVGAFAVARSPLAFGAESVAAALAMVVKNMETHPIAAASDGAAPGEGFEGRPL